MDKRVWIAMVVLGAAVLAGLGVGQAFANDTPPMVLRHVVLFKYKAEATPTEIRAVETAFAALPGKIPGIIGFEWGTNVSTEKLDKGFTHCFFVTFESEQARDDYLPHPDHKAFGNVLHPILDDVLVLDYWTKP